MLILRGMPSVCIVDRVDRFRLEIGIAFPADATQPVFQIFAALLAADRAEMIRGDDALAQLLEIGMRQQGAELGLADQKALERGGGADLEIGQHAQFFQRLDREVLRLVDQQQHPLSVAIGGLEEFLQLDQQRGLVGGEIGETEGGSHQAQQVGAVQKSGDDMGIDDAIGVDRRRTAARPGWSCPRRYRR